MPTRAILYAVVLSMTSTTYESRQASAEGRTMSDKTISIGTKLNNALAIFRSHGIKVEEETIATVKNAPGEATKEFVIRPLYDSEDALILIASSTHETNQFQVRRLNWYIKYAEDFRLPKLYRANRLLQLQSIDVNVLLPNKRAKEAPKSQSNKNPFQ